MEMKSEERPHRREILKLGTAALVGAASLKAGESMLGRTAKLEQAQDDEPSIEGPSPETEFSQVGEITWLQHGKDVEEKLESVGAQIRFEAASGVLQIFDEKGASLVELPGLREIAAVFVSSDRFSLSFEYRGKNGSHFGTVVGRRFEDGKLEAATWGE